MKRRKGKRRDEKKKKKKKKKKKRKDQAARSIFTHGAIEGRDIDPLFGHVCITSVSGDISRAVGRPTVVGIPCGLVRDHQNVRNKR